MVADITTITSFVVLVVIKLSAIPLPFDWLTRLKTSRLFRDFFCAIDPPVLRGFWHGTLCTEKLDYFPHVSLPRQEGSYDELPLPDVRSHAPGTAHTEGAEIHSGHEYVSKPCRIYGVQPGPGRTSRSGGSLFSGVPRRTFLPSAWGIRGKNRDALVSLASRHLLWTKRKPPQDCSHEGRLIYFHAIRIPHQKANILHDFTHYAFPNSRTVR